MSKPTDLRVPLVLLLLLALVVPGLGLVTATPARAQTLLERRCNAPDLGSGVCVGDSRGGVYWLGTRRGYDGVELFCIDYLYATRWGVEHRRTLATPGLVTSLGEKVGKTTLAAVTYLVTRYPADRADDTTAAAISLIVRQVMGDVRRGGVRTIPGGLTAESQVRDVAFIPDSVVQRATALWDEARVRRGPWSLSITLKRGPDAKITVGERIAAVVTARTASGAPQDATVRLDYDRLSGPDAVRLGKDGAARVTLVAPRSSGAGSVSARIASAPSPHPVVIVPTDWAVNRRPGHAFPVTQRGLVGRQVPVGARATTKVAIVKVTPVVTTVASAQKVEPGATLHDTVVVTGTRGAAASFRWSLLGPVAPEADGRCPGVAAEPWRDAAEIVSGLVTVSGDGTYRTPGHVVRSKDVGCLTYVEQLVGTGTTHPVTTPPGVAKETVLVTRPRSTPCVRTEASRQHGLIGTKLYDRVSVGCISGPDRVEVRWVAHGPISPLTVGTSGCDRIPVSAWRKAPVRARGSLVVAEAGTYRTSAFTVTKPGCYTFSESVAATPTTLAASTPPGIAVETALFTRPPVPEVPMVPSGPYRLSADHPGRTATYAGRIGIEALRINARVTKVGVSDGAMAIPRDPELLGWLRQTATVDDVVGSSVVAGHVASPSGRSGSLAALSRARPGMTVVWTDAGGARHRFVVAAVQKYPRSEPLPAALFRTDGPHVLRVVTCTDRVRRPDGSHRFASNLVVTAVAR